MPKVSVIIPCYNLGQYLEEAVDSVLNQTYQDFEIIIVNDGSTDEFTVNLLKNYQKPKTTLLNTKNQGLPSARNYGIEHSSGEYVCCLDADDKFHPKYLEKTLQKLVKDKKKEFGFVTTWVELFGNENRIWETGNYNPEQLSFENIIHVASLFRRICWDKVNGYAKNLVGYQDWNFWLSIISEGFKWICIKEPLFYYRIRKNSMVSGSNKKRNILFKRIITNNIKFYNKNVKEILSCLREKWLVVSEMYNNSKSILINTEFQLNDINIKLLDTEKQLKEAWYDSKNNWENAKHAWSIVDQTNQKLSITESLIKGKELNILSLQSQLEISKQQFNNNELLLKDTSGKLLKIEEELNNYKEKLINTEQQLKEAWQDSKSNWENAKLAWGINERTNQKFFEVNNNLDILKQDLLILKEEFNREKIKNDSLEDKNNQITKKLQETEGELSITKQKLQETESELRKIITSKSYQFIVLFKESRLSKKKFLLLPFRIIWFFVPQIIKKRFNKSKNFKNIIYFLKEFPVFKNSPNITVLMPVYNAEKYLKEAIESILCQTCSNFELLIINDGSTDSSKSIINSYYDYRIRLINNKKNIGITKSLNKGLKLAKGKFIARMDADDVAYPTRLERQYNYMVENKIDFLGSYFHAFNELNTINYIGESPQYHSSLLYHFCFRNCLVHSSMMFIKKAVINIGGYDMNAKHVEDYNLWCDAIKKYRFGVIPEALQKYRFNDESISINHSDFQNYNAYKITKRFLLFIAPECENDIIDTTLDLIYYSSTFEINEIKKKKALELLTYIEEKINKNIPEIEKQKISFIKGYLSENINNSSIEKIGNYYNKVRQELLEYSKNSCQNNKKNNRKDITIVILSFNRIQMTEMCIKSIIENFDNNSKILVIDNASSDATILRLKELEKSYKNINFIYLDENLGGGGGRVESLKYITTKYVLFLDNDIEVMPNSIENMYDFIENNPDCTVVSGKLVFPNGLIQLFGLEYSIDNSILRYHFPDAGKKFNDNSLIKEKIGNWINVGSTIYRTDILKKYPFDNSIGKYFYEDIEWCINNRDKSFKYYFLGDSIFIHNHEMFGIDKDIDYLKVKQNVNKRIIYAIYLFFNKHHLFLQEIFSYLPECNGKEKNEVEKIIIKRISYDESK